MIEYNHLFHRSCLRHLWMHVATGTIGDHSAESNEGGAPLMRTLVSSLSGKEPAELSPGRAEHIVEMIERNKFERRVTRLLTEKCEEFYHSAAGELGEREREAIWGRVKPFRHLVYSRYMKTQLLELFLINYSSLSFSNITRLLHNIKTNGTLHAKKKPIIFEI